MVRERKRENKSKTEKYIEETSGNRQEKKIKQKFVSYEQN